MTRNSESTNNSMKNGCGFFLLMLLGAVSAMVLPSVLYPPPNSSYTSEAMQYVGSMNRAQQAYFAEKNTFTSSVDALRLGIKTETKKFKYSVTVTKKAAFHYGISKNKKYKSYVGGVFIKSNNNPNEIKTESILCVANEPGTITLLSPTIQNGKLVCGSGTNAGPHHSHG